MTFPDFVMLFVIIILTISFVYVVNQITGWPSSILDKRNVNETLNKIDQMVVPPTHPTKESTSAMKVIEATNIRIADMQKWLADAREEGKQIKSRSIDVDLSELSKLDRAIVVEYYIRHKFTTNPHHHGNLTIIIRG